MEVINLWDYVEKYGIMEKIKGAIYTMLELFLLVVEKLIDNPKPLIIILLLFAAATLYCSKRLSHISSKVYVERKLSKMMKKQFREINIMFLPIAFFTEIMTKSANWIYGDGKPHDLSFIVYYIPMLCLVIFQRLIKVHKERKDNYLKCFIYLLPGTMFHMLFLTLLVCANKGIWVIALITALGILVPVLLDIIILFLVSPKDIKMVKIETESEECYNIRYKDLIKGKDEISIRLRDGNGKVVEAVIIKRDDLKKQTLYSQKPNIQFEDYYFK